MSHEPSLGGGLPDEGFARRIRTALAALLEPSDVTSRAPVPTGILAQLPDRGLVDRVAEQLSFACAELRRDPAGYIAALVAPDFADGRSRLRQRGFESAACVVGA